MRKIAAIVLAVGLPASGQAQPVVGPYVSLGPGMIFQQSESVGAAPVLAALAVPPSLGARIYLVFFDWDRADLTARARQIVAEAAQVSSTMRMTRIEVNGYTDLSGSVGYNQNLSERRAVSVRDELLRDGVRAGDIAIREKGERQYRRVEIFRD